LGDVSDIISINNAVFSVNFGDGKKLIQPASEKAG